jgi:hypothetical protein
MKLSEIVTGTPASIVYPHDSRAAVVVRRTPKRIVIARVETGPTVRVDGGSGDTPPIVEAVGILDKIVEGSEVTLTLRERKDGSVYAENGNGCRVALGHSVSRTNYQNF